MGLMSGTSLDGLDLAACRFHLENEQWKFELQAADSISYTATMRQSLQESVGLSGLDLSLLDVELGRFFGEKVREFCHARQLQPDFIGSHGHTVFHQPDKLLTLQIGNPEAISHFSGYPVVANFRIADVLNGGQGAPLVPFGEHHLFPAYKVFLNLGGISNVALHNGAGMSGFDVSACNMGLNYLAARLGLAYDKDGKLARSGSVHQPLLDSLNNLPYFRLSGPKSLGFEWFEAEVAPLLDRSGAATEDALATFVEHIAWQVNKSLLPLCPQPEKVMTTGGGALNSFLLEKLNEHGEGRLTFEAPDRLTIEFKEALVFAFLALQRVLGNTNISKQVTGAKKDVSGGSFHGAFKLNF